ncbi:MAG: M64 family metallopeptidase [Prolixibacteraceae bacterium]
MVRICLILLTVFIALPEISRAQNSYSSFFTDSVLRVDYLLAGNDEEAHVFLQQLKKEPYYGGSKTNLIDRSGYGTFRYRMLDRKSGKLIFSKGFSSLFQEWQSTREASLIKRSFYQVAILPFPVEAVTFVIDQKDRSGHFQELFSLQIDPDNYFILNERVLPKNVETVIRQGDPANKVDLVFLPEGYRQEEMGKFMADVVRMTDILFAAEPFAGHKKDFNVYVSKIPSLESGTDIPGELIHRNTAFNSTFYTFNISRYLTTTDLKGIHDAVSGLPYDHVLVLVNSDRYGGGGFFNLLTVVTAGNAQTPQVLVHEFGHAFAGLADEYYSSAVAYDDYYPLTVEPWEPNITTRVDFKEKWADLLDRKTPVPTPRSDQYKDVTGVFEGGGYMSKGIFSPAMDCRMKSNGPKGFCPVCTRAVVKAIDWHCR